MAKKKILFILHVPPPIHGSSIVGEQLMKSKLINTYFNSDYINLGTSSEISDIGGWNYNKTRKYLGIIFSILKRIIFTRYDQVYLAPTVSGVGFYKDFVIVSIIKLFQKNLIFHLHNKGVVFKNNNIINSYLHKFFFNGVDVILLSKLLYEDIQEFVPEAKIYICPNGIEARDNLEWNIVNKRKNKIPVILFLSNLIESKGVFTLLDSCKILKDQEVSFMCYLVGGEGDISKSDLERKIKKFDLCNHVVYLGKKYGNEKDEIFLNSDIFAFPSYYKNECFPLVCLEALQYSIPLISTNEGGIPDIVESDINGYIVPKNNPVELAVKLRDLIINERLRVELGARGRNKFLDNYTLAHFEKNMLSILIHLS
mgnify:CR=1 FL=1